MSTVSTTSAMSALWLGEDAPQTPAEQRRRCITAMIMTGMMPKKWGLTRRHRDESYVRYVGRYARAETAEARTELLCDILTLDNRDTNADYEAKVRYHTGHGAGCLDRKAKPTSSVASSRLLRTYNPRLYEEMRLRGDVQEVEIAGYRLTAPTKMVVGGESGGGLNAVTVSYLIGGVVADATSHTLSRVLLLCDDYAGYIQMVDAGAPVGMSIAAIAKRAALPYLFARGNAVLRLAVLARWEDGPARDAALREVPAAERLALLAEMTPNECAEMLDALDADRPKHAAEIMAQYCKLAPRGGARAAIRAHVFGAGDPLDPRAGWGWLGLEAVYGHAGTPALIQQLGDHCQGDTPEETAGRVTRVAEMLAARDAAGLPEIPGVDLWLDMAMSEPEFGA